MLVLTRRIGEKITISNDVKVIIVGFTGKQVRVGINAPSNIPVHREEIYKRINNSNGLKIVEDTKTDK